MLSYESYEKCIFLFCELLHYYAQASEANVKYVVVSLALNIHNKSYFLNQYYFKSRLLFISSIHSSCILYS